MNKTHYLVPLILVLGLTSLAILPLQQLASAGRISRPEAPGSSPTANPAGSNMTGGSNMTALPANMTGGIPSAMPAGAASQKGNLGCPNVPWTNCGGGH